MAREIRMRSRGFRTEFEQSISGDLVRALVELITNSDDSYTRAVKDGAILVRFEKVQGGDPRDTTRVSVIDQAEGMDESDLEIAADVGVESSGFARKKTIRGLLGRGLKQAVFGIGVRADIASIKNETLSHARLYDGPGGECLFSRGSEFVDDFDIGDHSPRKATLRDRESFGIENDGTCVTLFVSDDKWRTPKQFPKVRLSERICG